MAMVVKTCGSLCIHKLLHCISTNYDSLNPFYWLQWLLLFAQLPINTLPHANILWWLINILPHAVILALLPTSTLLLFLPSGNYPLLCTLFLGMFWLCWPPNASRVAKWDALAAARPWSVVKRSVLDSGQWTVFVPNPCASIYFASMHIFRWAGSVGRWPDASDR